MTILIMSLLLFGALNVSVALLSMHGQKAHVFHKKYLNFKGQFEWISQKNSLDHIQYKLYWNIHMVIVIKNCIYCDNVFLILVIPPTPNKTRIIAYIFLCSSANKYHYFVKRMR